MKRAFAKFNSWLLSRNQRFLRINVHTLFTIQSKSNWVYFLIFFQFPLIKITFSLFSSVAGKGIYHVNRNINIPTAQFVFLLCLNGTHLRYNEPWHDFQDCSVTRCVALSVHCRASPARRQTARGLDSSPTHCENTATSKSNTPAQLSFQILHRRQTYWQISSTGVLM